MAIDKDPSIYRDRGTIGSSDELDEYGVWVKSEPQDIVSSGGRTVTLVEPVLPDIEDLPDLELDPDSDFGFPSIEVPTLTESGKVVAGTLDNSKDKDDSIDFSVEDLVPEFDQDSAFEEVASFSADGSSAASTDDFTELSMEDFLDGNPLSVSATKVDDMVVEEEALTMDLDFNESVDLDYSTGNASSSFDIPEDSQEEGALRLEAVSDFDDFLNDLSPDTENKGIAEEAEEILPDFETEDAIALSVSGGPKEEPFDDVEALHRELADPSDFSLKKTDHPATEALPIAPSQRIDLSTQLLMRIADELSSIKNELSSLKGELTILKGEAKLEPPIETQEQDSVKGFFDEEDDEKIALTGDELDNILNTADFTEEAGADAVAEETVSLDLDTLGKEDHGSREPEVGTVSEGIPEDGLFLSDKDDILDGEEEEGSRKNEGFGVDDIGIAEIIPEMDTAALPEELVRLQADGVSPMTAPPDDTSYLEDESFDLDNLDLTEAVIEEPDLGSFLLEEVPVEEPSIESIHIDLDTEEEILLESTDEFESLDAGQDEVMELSMEDSILEIGQVNAEELDIFDVEAIEEAPVLEESFEEIIPEGFVVGPEEIQAPPENDLGETVELMDAEEETRQKGDVPLERGPRESRTEELPSNLKQEIKTVLSYMDQLLESLPEEKIEEFARSEYFDTYKKLFEELGLI